MEKRVLILLLIVSMPMVMAELVCYPTFESIGCRASGSPSSATFEYREAGQVWQQGLEPVIINGMIYANAVYLKRDTAYEVRLSYSGIQQVADVRTWSHDQPAYGTCRESASTDSELTNALSKCNGKGGIITLSGTFGKHTIQADGTTSAYLLLTGTGTFTQEMTLSDARYMHIKGLIFKAGIDVSGAPYTIIEDNTFDGDSGNIELRDSIEGLLIQNNRFRNICQPGANGEQGNCGENWEDDCIQLQSAKNPLRTVIRDNDITDCRDGIGQDSSQSWEEVDIYGNNIYDIYDDGLETDGPDVNVRVWGNNFHGGGSSTVSITPCVQGPIYYFNNIFAMAYSDRYAIKSGGGSGKAFFFHNTAYLANKNTRYQQDADGAERNVVHRNNLIYSTYYWFEAGGCGYYLANNNFDPRAGSEYKVKWHYYNDCGTQVYYKSYAEWRNAESADNGMVNELSVDSKLVSPGTGDYRLQASSPLIDAASCIPGITKDYAGNPRQSGVSCDIGALEFSSSGCSNECTSGAKQCSGNGFQTCGNYDADSCTEWSSVTTCVLGQSCSGGVCSAVSATCGNNLPEGSEVCDGIELAGQTCISKGYSGGALKCLPTCSGFDTSSCVSATEMIIDDIDPGFTKTGVWQLSGYANPYKTDSYWASVNSGNTATWLPAITKPGKYTLYAWWTSGDGIGRANDAKYKIITSAGETIISVNQKINGGQWNLLGTFDMALGSKVQLIDHSTDPGFVAGQVSDSVCADAIRFVYIGASCTDADLDCDNCVIQDELFAYIAKWKSGQITLANLMEAIGLWKNGC